MEAIAEQRRAAPADAFALARAKFLAGERLDMQALAAELGVNRATLYRWVGSKELLLGEVISSLSLAAFERARRDIKGSGPKYVAKVVQTVLEGIRTNEPMQKFLDHDATYALKVLTSKESNVQLRGVEAIRGLLEEQVASGALETPADLGDLAYVIMRISEGFVYSDVIIGAKPDVAKAGQMVRLLLGDHSA